VDLDGDGTYWLVYLDGTFPDGVPGVNCDLTQRWIWAVEVDLAQPAAFDPADPPRFVHLSSPEPYPWWSGYPGVWSWDGRHLAAVQWPEGGHSARELIVYDVEFTADGVPQLMNPWSLTPNPQGVPGRIFDVAWANWSDTLVVSAEAALAEPMDIWMCAVDFGNQTCGGGWTNLTPGNQDYLLGACFSGNDSELVVSLTRASNPSPVASLYVGPFVPFAPLDLQLLVPAPKFTKLIHPDWRP
jgi:hypothetical protein